MEGSGQPQGPTTLPLEKEPVITEFEARWAPQPVGILWQTEKFHTPLGFKLQIVHGAV